MIEIYCLYTLCKTVGRIIREKGKSPGLYQFLTVIFWFGGEIVGAIVGAVVNASANGDGEGTPLLAYVFALIGAALGAWLSYSIAKGVAPVESIKAKPTMAPGGEW